MALKDWEKSLQTEGVLYFKNKNKDLTVGMFWYSPDSQPSQNKIWHARVWPSKMPLKKFTNKSQALKFVKDYMRRN